MTIFILTYAFLFLEILIFYFLYSAVQDITSSSPRINQRNIKKPAAPPPPAQRSGSCDKNIGDSFPTGELIDFSGDGVDSPEKLCDTPIKSEKPNFLPITPETERSTVVNISRRKSNESFNKNELVNVLKTEKPAIPDKQAAYSSCSLDRRNHRQYSSAKGDKIPECMVRSHIERPTVPPPERPAKPPKFCSSENVSGNNPVKGNGDEITTQPQIKSCPLTPDKVSSDGQQDNASPTPNTKSDQSPSSLQHSRSSSKINRFDFLVNQTNDKPPERPPRSNVDHTERTFCIPETPEKDSSQNVSNISPPENVSQSISAPPPISPRSPRSPRPSEGEKVKPPRPQPPVKPKFNTSNENTSL